MGGELLGTATCRRVGVTEPRAGLPPPPGRLGCWAQGGGDGFRRRPPPVRWVLSPHNVPSRPGNKPRGVLSHSLLPPAVGTAVHSGPASFCSDRPPVTERWGFTSPARPFPGCLPALGAEPRVRGSPPPPLALGP